MNILSKLFNKDSNKDDSYFENLYDEDHLVINKVRIERGEEKFIDMKVAKLFDHTDMTIPILVIRGKERGPRLFISSAIHGDEISGVAVIRDLVSNRKKLFKDLKGTLILVPIVNIFGFNRNIRYLPDRRDLNRCFPGSKNGSLTAQIAYFFTSEILNNSDYGIDLHTAALHKSNLPQIRVNVSDPILKELALAFGAPVILDSKLRSGSLRKIASKRNVKTLLFEGGEALRFDEDVISFAKYGVLSVMHKIGMISENSIHSKISKPNEIIISNKSYWARATHAGIVNMYKHLGDKVKKGAILACISDSFGVKNFYVKAKENGIIIGIATMPLVTNGDAIIHIMINDD